MERASCVWDAAQAAVPEGLLVEGRTRKPPSTAARVSVAVASCRLNPVIQGTAASVDDSPTSSSPANPLYADRAERAARSARPTSTTSA